jgi:maltose alpha-D-glucosyltransferase/alpha-amylase
MLRSFDYAAGSVLHGLATVKGRPPGIIRAEDRPAIAGRAEAWVDFVGNEFVAAYLEEVGPAGVLPEQPEACRRLLGLMQLEKALQEIDAELTFRPEWVVIPLQGALRLVERADA